MNSKIYLRNISNNYLLLLNFRPLFPASIFFVLPENWIIITRHLRHLFVTRFVKNTLTTVMIDISRITFTVLTFRVIVIEVLRFDNKKKKLFEQDIIFVSDLLFELDSTNSFTIVSNKISKIKYLLWAGPRHSVPTHVHLKTSNCLRSEISLIFTIDNKKN